MYSSLGYWRTCNLDKESHFKGQKRVYSFCKEQAIFRSIECGMKFFRGRNKWKVRFYEYTATFFFLPELSLVEPRLILNTNLPAHLATQILLVFSLSVFHSAWGSFLASHMPTSPTLLHLQDSWKLTKENFCLHLQIPVLSASF